MESKGSLTVHRLATPTFTPASQATDLLRNEAKRALDTIAAALWISCVRWPNLLFVHCQQVVAVALDAHGQGRKVLPLPRPHLHLLPQRSNLPRHSERSGDMNAVEPALVFSLMNDPSD